MPKVKWGSISEQDINEAEVSQNYAGKIPPTGVYRFVLSRLKVGQSGEGNPKVVVMARLDGSWRKEHKKFNGCPLFDHIAVIQSQNFKVRALCDALGVTAKQFMNQTVTDEDDNILKIGTLKIHEEDLLIYISVQHVNDAEYGEQLRTARGGGYMPAPEDDDGEDGEDVPAEDDEDDE